MTDPPAGPAAADRSQPATRAVAVVVLGVLAGLAFVLPILAFVRTAPGSGRSASVVLAAIVAVLLIRRLGRRLTRLLDSLPQPWRLPLLAAYAVSAMALPASLLLWQPPAVTPPARPAAPPAAR